MYVNCQFLLSGSKKALFQILTLDIKDKKETWLTCKYITCTK